MLVSFPRILRAPASTMLARALVATLLAGGMGASLAGPGANGQRPWRFDFGDGPVEPGYTGVRAEDAYTPEKQYGFSTPEYMANVAANGTGVGSDAVRFLQFGTKSGNTFNVDLKPGLYRVSVTLGNTSRASVAAEGVYQVLNMTGNNATDAFEIPVTDGQLNLLVTEGKAGTAFTLSALEIKRISRNPGMGPTIWVGGDSTVANYYPLETSVQGGWGQLLPDQVDPRAFQVRNIATGGQIARGFRDSGQLETILQYSKEGDLFLLEMGINDTNPKNETTEAQFKEIMRDMVRQVAATGARPVLVTPQGRATDFNAEGVHSAVNRWYRHATLALAAEENVPVVDLNVLSSAYFTQIGPEATLALYMAGDTLHPNRAGAAELARLVAQDLERQQILPAAAR